MASYSLSNINTNDDWRPHIVSSIVACMVFAGISVIGRVVSRRINKLELSASDFLSVGGLLGAWVISLIVIEEAKLGLGRHIEVVPLANVRMILLTTYIGEIFYSITFPMVKLSILLLYRSIFPGKGMMLATNIVATFVIGWGISLLLVSIFSCKPIHGFWDVTVKSTCVDSKWFFVGNSIPNMIADLVILCLPMRKVWLLKMSTRSKWAVSAIFLLGGFVVVASALRVYFMLTMNPSDITWTYVGVGLWTAVEIDVAVTSACLPTLRPVLSHLVPVFFDVFKSRIGRSKGTHDSSNNTHLRGEEFQRLPEYQMQSMK